MNFSKGESVFSTRSIVVFFVIILIFLIIYIQFKTEAVLKNGNVMSFITGDKSEFIDDITIPDGTIVKVNQIFDKTWEIKNIGSIVWENRFLQREVTEDNCKLKSVKRVEIPYTLPGQRVQITVRFQAPNEPCGRIISCWKMADKNGKYLLPNQIPLYVDINVQ